MTAHDPLVIAARRTPIGTRGRGLAHVPVDQLAAPVVRACVREGLDALTDARPVADVVLGNCMGPGGNPARIAALAAGLDVTVPGMTLDRQCGSGLAAVVEAATAIRAGDDRLHLAGGAESASTAPTRSIAGVPYDRAAFTPTGFPDPSMTRAAEDLASRTGITRARQDAAAVRSHRRAHAARARGAFSAELVPVGNLDHDDAIGTAVPASVHRFAPLFPGGTVTAGNACRVSDGAAVVAVIPSSGRAPGHPALALRAHATVGCDPALPGLGAAPAIRAALERAGADVRAVGAFEIVDAFAAQSLAVLEELGIDDADPRVCADGSALALGHPWGASGAVSVVRLFSRLIRSEAPAGTIGVAAASIGGGMGVAAVFEVLR